MAKKPEITEEEEQEFRNAMYGVKPLKTSSRAKRPTSIKEVSKRKTIASKDFSVPIASSLRHMESLLDYLPSGDWLGTEDPLHFACSGLGPKTLKQLRQGKIYFTARLDLHQATLAAAEQKLEQFIHHSQTKGLRCVLVIHGKGYRSGGDKPRLKNAVNLWLRQHPDVLAFHSATARDGGTGAVYILLKSKMEKL